MNKKWLRKTIQNFTPYVVPEIKEKIIINANESPYHILDFPKVKQDFLEGLEKLASYRYPDPLANELRAALGEYVGVQKEQVLATNGGDELINLIMNTFLDEGDTLLVHIPTFDVYASTAEILGATVIKVPGTDDFKCDTKAFKDTVQRIQPKISIICNPNNPTGELWSLDTIEEILKIAENPVVVDEAYLEFANQESVIPLLQKYDNLIVIRTLSKAFGLAGYRLGYGVATADMISALTLTKLYYNLNSVTQLMGLVAMKHRDEILQHNVPPTIEARDYLITQLNEIEEVTTYPSSTNFILLKVPHAEIIIEALRKADICIRYYSSKELTNCIRITATTKDVANQILRVFREVFTHA